MPASNAVSERSFSAMRHFYTYLHTNMLQGSLNHTMVFHIIKINLHLHFLHININSLLLKQDGIDALPIRLKLL